MIPSNMSISRLMCDLGLLQIRRTFSRIRPVVRHFQLNYASILNFTRSRIVYPREFPKLRLIVGGIIPVLLANATDSFIAQDFQPKVDMESVLRNADTLYQETDYKKIYNLLTPYKDEENDEVLWRLARAAYEMAKFCKNVEERDNLNTEAFNYVERALTINANNFAVHKWMAILLDTVSETQGTKARISQSEKIKTHIKRATELNPMDATSFYMLGVWCFSFADLPWYQRKIAAVIFASPPASTYEEALEAFLQAEKIEPQFYSKNLLMLGKTYWKLGNIEDAIRFLIQVKNYPVKTEEDKEAYKEAIDTLKMIGVDS